MTGTTGTRAALAGAWLLGAGCVADPPVNALPQVVAPIGTVSDTFAVGGSSDAAVLDAFFSGAEKEVIEIELGDFGMADLVSFPENWEPATLRWRGIEFPGVGVRVKGNGSFSPITEKPSLKIEFDKFAEGQDFFGLDVLVLDNMLSDGSKLKERLAYRMYREMGVPAARAAHCLLVVDGVPYGLYTHLEDVDDRLLARWFARSDGPLYELFDTDLTPDGVAAFEHEGGPDDRTALIGAADALALPTREEQIAAVESWVDLDAFLRYYAVSGYIGQFDAWPFNEPSDDVHLYVDPTSQRIHVVPHGLDESFQQFFRHVGIPGPNPLGEACYFTDDCHDRFVAEVWATHERAQAIDLVAELQFARAQVEWDALADNRDQHTDDEVLLQMDVLEQYLLLREDHLIENLGPP